MTAGSRTARHAQLRRPGRRFRPLLGLVNHGRVVNRRSASPREHDPVGEALGRFAGGCRLPVGLSWLPGRWKHPVHNRWFRTGPGEGERVSPAMTLKVGDAQSKVWSMFEVVDIGPGFDVGAHLHRNAEELFYLLEGQLDLLAFEPRLRTPGNWQDWESHTGARVARGGPGSMMYVPRGCPHASANPGPGPARMIFLVPPPATSTTRRSSRSWSPAPQGHLTRRSPSCAPATTSNSSPLK